MARPAAPLPGLQIEGLDFAHPGQAPLFSGWSATLPAGLVWLGGDTGSGKTTLLRLLAGQWPAQAGRIRWGRLMPAQDAAAWQQRVCWIEPDHPAWDRLTPAGLRAAQAALHPGQHPPQSLPAWRAHLAGLGLGPHLHKPMFALSTGTRRKAALAVALSCTAPLVLLDEPGAGLDSASLRHLAGALATAATAPGRVWVLASGQGRDAVPGAPDGCLLACPGPGDPSAA